MRPRVFPAEDGPVLYRAREQEKCFNEAAGIPRGRPGDVRARHPLERASMRPRVFPAEDGPSAYTHELDILASMRPRVFPAEDP